MNAVCGSKLIWVDASTLPRMGVTDWNHIQVNIDRKFTINLPVPGYTK